MIATPGDRVIRCDRCNAIAAVERDDMLVIQHRHHGEKHETKVALDRQKRMPAK